MDLESIKTSAQFFKSQRIFTFKESTSIKMSITNIGPYVRQILSD